MEEAQTYLGERFWKSMPPRNGISAPWNTKAAVSSADAPLQLMSLNHMALGVDEVDTMTKWAHTILRISTVSGADMRL